MVLKSIGRLNEASQPMKVSLDWAVDNNKWKSASMRASNLSSLYLTLGQVQKAVGMARRSVDFADRSGDFHAQCFGFGALGASFHQSGKLQESENSFQELESIQKEKQPGSRYLYSFQGFLFCDLLLSRGRVQEVLERAGCALDYSKEPWYSMHSCALDNLSLGPGAFITNHNRRFTRLLQIRRLPQPGGNGPAGSWVSG